MPVICPTVTANDLHQYREQLELAVSISDRVHVDLMDGIFTESKSPPIESLWISHDANVDIHLMYKNPIDVLSVIEKLKPNMVIIHAEVEVHHMHFASVLHSKGINAGLAMLQHTQVKEIKNIMHSFDQILIFSGNLGYHGGSADLSLLYKIDEIREEYPEVEIAWDGGVNDNNSKRLTDAGIDVLNVGSFIQGSDNPKHAYQKISNSLL